MKREPRSEQGAKRRRLRQGRSARKSTTGKKGRTAPITDGEDKPGIRAEKAPADRQRIRRKARTNHGARGRGHE